MIHELYISKAISKREEGSEEWGGEARREEGRDRETGTEKETERDCINQFQYIWTFFRSWLAQSINWEKFDSDYKVWY